MKKILSGILVLLLSITLFACGEEPPAPVFTLPSGSTDIPTPTTGSTPVAPIGTTAGTTPTEPTGTTRPEETTTVTPRPSETGRMAQVRTIAESYIEEIAFSRVSLVKMLIKYEGMTTEEADYGADSCGADWKAQAVRMANEYVSSSSFSRKELASQLEYEGFTAEESAHGVANCSADWKEQAVAVANTKREITPSLTKEGLSTELAEESFSAEEIAYALSKITF